MEELIKRAEEMGINVEDLIVLALSKLDPKEGVKIRLELAEKYLREAEDYLKRGDSIQASKKAYKVAEELVKALAEEFNLPEYQQALKEGRWYTYLLTKAANSLANKLGNWVSDGWSNGYVLNVWGFHEAKLTINDVTSYINRIRDMLNGAKKILTS
ncbi:MAG: PaREP1 family protein [Sulfolobaceae archaeon]